MSEKILLEITENVTGDNYLWRVVKRGDEDGDFFDYEEYKNGLESQSESFSTPRRALVEIIDSLLDKIIY